MSALTCKTRGGSSPQGKPRVFFCCYPEDFQPFFEEISDSILKTQNCAIWYFENPEQVPDTEQMETDLGQMQLFVVPVTTKLLTKPNFAMDSAIPFALEKHIPVLPLMQEDGLIELFGKKFGDIQYLDKNQMDDTAIPYEEKLEKYLSSVLVGDELAAKVRAAFDAYIFLSYRKKDRKYAQELMRLIHQNEFCQDIAIWYDEFLTPGENFNEAIADALQKSGLFTLVVTPNLVNEPNYVMSTEYPMAKEADKLILPAELVKTDKEALKSHYAGLPDCTDAHDSKALSESLLEAVQKFAIQENDSSPEHNFFIGLAYLSGIDVEVDHRRALSLIEGAANAGLTEAMEKLVSMYRNGEGVERNYRTAIEWQAKLVEVLRQKFQAEPNEENALSLVNAYWYQGDYENELWDLKAAEKSYMQMLRFVENVQKQFPKLKQEMAAVYDIIGDIQKNSGKLSDAVEYYMKSIQVSEQLIAELGIEWPKRTLSICFNNIGDIRKSERKFAEAAEYYEKALKITEQLAEESGTEETRRALAIRYEKMGDIRQADGNLSKAAEYYRKSLQIREQLAAENNTAEARRDLSISYNRMGNVRKAEGKLSEAAAYYQDFLRIAEQIVEETETMEARRDLSISYTKMGDIRQAEGKLAEAKEYYRKSLKIREQLAEETGTMQAKRDLSVNYSKLAQILKKEKKLLEAAIYYQMALRTDEELVAVNQSVKFKRDLAINSRNVGDIWKAEGNLSEAVKFYEKSFRMWEQIAAEIRTAEARRELANSCSNLGNVQKALGKLLEAIGHYAKALQIWEALAAETGAAEVRDDLAVACYNLGVLGKEFTHYLRKAHTIWDELANECPDAPRYQKNRDIVAEMLQNQN